MAFRYRYRNNREKLLFVLVIISLTISVFALISSQKLNLPSFPEIFSLPELSTLGYVKVKADAAVMGNQGVVSLSSECYQLTANTEAAQAESILKGIAGRIEFRPNTHDLMKDVLNSFGIEVVMVKVVELKNNTFFGRIVLKQGDKIVSLDSRPSDGIALAVRTNSSIYVKEDLLKSHGKKIC